MNDRERLLDDLARFAMQHPDYSGCVEFGLCADKCKLRYYNETTNEFERAHNSGVRTLDLVAKRIVQVFPEILPALPAAETQGAAVMAWLLSDRRFSECGRYPRVSASASANAFDDIRERLLTLANRDPANIIQEERDKTIWQNITSMSCEELQVLVNDKKKFPGCRKITSFQGFKDAALRYSQPNGKPTRNFSGEIPWKPLTS